MGILEPHFPPGGTDGAGHVFSSNDISALSFAEFLSRSVSGGTVEKVDVLLVNSDWAEWAYLEALAHLAEHVLHGHGGVVEIDRGRVGRLDAHLLLGGPGGHPAKAPLHDERRDAFLRVPRLRLHRRLQREKPCRVIDEPQ